MKNKKSDVLILCGGKGTRLSEETITKPKPMIEIGGKPILWHIMKIYAHYGFKKFVLPLGYKGNYIKKYFYDYKIISNDFTLSMNPNSKPKFHDIKQDNWEITFVDTGLNTLKGGRIKRIEKYIESDNFHVTYGDGIANININKLHRFHINHNYIGTLTAVQPPSRFGEIKLSGNEITYFEEKAQLESGYINGGFFVFKKDFFDYLDINSDFEFGPLQQLAKDRELYAYKHNDFWQCMDNVRDKIYLNKLWNENNAKWRIWK